LASFWLPPAYADEDDQAISEAQIRHLQATIAGKAVKFEVLKITEDADGNKLVNYRLKDLPLSDENVIIEFSSPSGSFKLKGIFPKIVADLPKAFTRIDIDTTALTLALQSMADDENDFSESELQTLIKSETVQEIRNQIYAHFLQGQVGQGFEDSLKSQVQLLVSNSPLKQLLAERRQCKAQHNCTPAFQMPPQKEKALPETLQKLIRQRLQKRAATEKLVLAPLAPNQTDQSAQNEQGHAPTEQEKEALLKLGPIARKRACLEKQIQPCP
jgi:hypothetical protein